jgi:hypothetical protein
VYTSYFETESANEMGIACTIARVEHRGVHEKQTAYTTLTGTGFAIEIEM